jgi:hypothetical protein
VGDVTGDGSKEILAGNNHLYAWNWNGIELRDDDGDPQTWGVFSQEIQTITGALAIGEMDRSSPGFEIFATSWEDTNKAWVVRGNGSFLPGWPQKPDPNSAQKGYWADSAVMDVDGDGLCEVWAPAKNGNLYAWHWNGTPLGGSPIWKSGFGTYARTAVSFANIDGDPARGDHLRGTERNAQHLERRWVERSELPEVAGNGFVWQHRRRRRQQGRHPGRRLPHRRRRHQRLQHQDGQPADRLAEGLVDEEQPEAAVAGLVRPELRRLPRDRRRQQRFPTSGSSVSVYDYQGNLRPGWPILVGGHTSESSPIVADVSGDGIPDILFGNEGGLIYGWNRDGVNLAGLPAHRR